MSAVRRTLAAIALVGALAVGLAACAGGDHDGDHMDGGAMTMGTAAMMDADAMFAQMMIPHHAQAIEMADLALDPARGASPEVVALAEQIRAAQDPEIAQMRSWLGEWGVPEMSGDEMMGEHAGHGGMAGMLSPEQLEALADSEGPAFDRLFLEGMIAHHEGAIEMAEDVKADGDDPRVLELADAIIASQQAEIDEMRRLLEG